MKYHFYAVWVNYLPNSAPSTRMLSYLDAWSKMDIEVTVVFFLPDRQYSKVPYHYKNIKFQYFWDYIPWKCRPFHYVIYNLYIRKFRNSLKSGDCVYVYGQANFLPFIRKRNDIKVYHETTEHPSVVPLGVMLHKTTIDKYLECCTKLDGIFVISSHLKNFFANQGIDPGKIEVVNMTVNPSRFAGVIKESSKKYIAYCGNATNNKDGVDNLIKSFSLISTKFPDIFLYIIGQAPNRKDKSSNARLAQELGVAERVLFVGMVNYNDMPQILTNATILALCRPDNIQAKYGFPTKLGEYLLTGNPVVITDTGDVSKFLVNRKSAMIANPNNNEVFSEMIEWLLNHPDEAIAIGKNGKDVAIKCFNAQVEAKKIVDFMFKNRYWNDDF